MKLSCHYSGYYCDSDCGYYYLKFGRNGKITDFSLFWPGGTVTQKISKDELEITVHYPEYGFTIRIHFHLACDANYCVPLVYSGAIEMKYKGMGTVTACGISADYCGYYGESVSAKDAEVPVKVESFEKFINNLIDSQLSNLGNN